MITTHRSTVHAGGKVYRTVLEEVPRNWSAHVPALPGLVVTGANREDLTARLRDAIAFHLDGLRRHGMTPAQQQKAG